MHRFGFLMVCAVAICAPAMGSAQRYSFDIDYEALFLLHADRITDTTRGDFQVLNMPGGVVLDRRGSLGNYDYSGSDSSDGGAVGCYMLFLIEYKKIDTICPGRMTDAQSAQLDDGLDRVLRFIAENTYPPADYETLEAYATLQVFMEWLSMGPNTDSYCSGHTFLSDFIEYYDGLEDGRFQRDLDKVLEVPRLPVMNPCL